ncbi:hypothetical protein PspLS_10107 [Pyricularia sp. CBS 133598]|nr:hypothetical protein PspLS_10107 [Pyricularia sp. CBS 133598]
MQPEPWWDSRNYRPPLLPPLPPARPRFDYGAPLFCPFNEPLRLRDYPCFHTDDHECVLVSQLDCQLKKLRFKDESKEDKQFILKGYRTIPFDETLHASPCASKSGKHYCDLKIRVSQRGSPPTRQNELRPSSASISFALTTAQVREFGKRLEGKGYRSTWRRIPYTIVMTAKDTHFDVTGNCAGHKIPPFKVEYEKKWAFALLSQGRRAC